MKHACSFLTLLIFISLILSCQSESGNHSHEHHDENHVHQPEIKVEGPIVEPDTVTRKMMQLVNSAYELVDPEKIKYYLNSERAAIIKQMMANLEGPQKFNAEIQYAQEVLNAGSTMQAIQIFEKILEKLPELNAPNEEEFALFVKKNLGIAYIRKAEQDNCLANHTAESCIIPFSEKAQHKIRMGSERAIELFNDVLAGKPNDAECKYLLNIAHMTIGQYPDDVPEEHRIDPEYFYPSQEFPKFNNIADQLGVGSNGLSGGVCIDDFNGDGYLDIIASSWGFTDQIKYYVNDKNGGFIDYTNQSGMKGVYGGLNLKHGDYNNDGFIDFIILRGAWFFTQGKIPNSLMRNNGDGTFTDVTLEAGVFSERPTQTAIWDDFNLDGWLDLFIANESNTEFQNPCELFINQGDGTFKNETTEAGVVYAGFFKGAASGDLNNDGYPEIYLSNLGGKNVLLFNATEGSKTQFKRASISDLDEPRVSFPTWIFDYNNDGLNDVFVSGYSIGNISAAALMMEGLNGAAHENRPYIYKNNGNGRFTEVSRQLGILEPSTTMGCNFGDLDNDGYLDFYLATGEPSLYSIVPNRMYRNVEGNKFEDVTYPGGFGHLQKGHAVSFADLDFDGDQDIYAVMGGAFEGDVYRNVLYENTLGEKNNWITISLEGSVSNRSAIGARIALTITENGKMRSIYHTVGTGASFGSNSLRAEMGVGKATIIDKLEIQWPNQARTMMAFENIPVNMHVYVNEADQRLQKLSVPHVGFAKSNNYQHHH